MRTSSIRVLTAIWLSAFGIRLIYVWQIAAAPVADLRLGDAEAYHLWAQQIAQGDWLGAGVFYQSPLYPYVLAVIYNTLGDSTLVVRLVQAAVGATSCALLGAAGISLFGRPGMIAGLGLAIYPAGIFLDGLPEKSAFVTLFTTALLAALAAHSARPVRWLGAGVLLGLLVLTRENALLLAAPILWWIWRGPVPGPGRTTAAWLFAAGCIAVLAPVALRNLAVGGELHLTTSQFGPNFYIGNHAGASGTYDALVVGHGSAQDERMDATQLAEQARGRRLSPAEVSSYWTGEALAYIRSHPRAWLQLLGRKLALTVNSAEVADTESLEVYAEWSSVLRLLGPFDFGVLLTLAAFGTIVTWRSWQRLWFVHALAGTYALTVVLFYVFARYRFPIVPMLMLAAAGGLVEARRRSAGRLAIAGAAAALAFACANLALEDASASRAAHYAGIAGALAKDPARYGEAERFYARALAEAPGHPAAQFGLATLLARDGRHDDAIPRYREALRSWPSHVEARYNLGLSLARTGQLAAAADQYREALALRPDDLEARLALARTLVSLGRPALAVAEYERILASQPRLVTALVGLGVALAQSDRADEALVAFHRALALDPMNASAHNSLGFLLATRGRLADAIPHFERAVALNPHDENARQNLERARAFK
jgi:tetratricopeptide (TPR) repeat protein